MPPQPPVDNRRQVETGGIFESLLSAVRKATTTTTTPVGGTQRDQARPPRGLLQPGPDDLRQPNAHAATAPKILRRGQRAAAAAGGHAPVAGAPPDISYRCEAMARAALRRCFAAQPGTATDERLLSRLIARLFDFVVPGMARYENPVLLGTVLARLTGRDPAAAIAVLEGLVSAEPQGLAFEAQLALAGCGGPGIDCLLRLHPVVDRAADPLRAAIQREAFATRLQTASRLCASLPSHQRPRSLAACVALARRAACAAPGSPDADLHARWQLLVDGLLCAQALVDDPAAESAPALRSAYLAVRNGIFDRAHLERTQARLFKLNTYLQRVSERGLTRFGHALQRPFGRKKSPLAALVRLGTVQSKARHPADDIALRCVAMDAFVQRMNQRLVGRPTVREPGDTALRTSLLCAIVRHWKQHAVDHGWQDALPIGGRLRRAIVADVAAQLGCDPGRVVRHPVLREAGVLRVALLDRWARQERIDYRAPATPADGRSFGEAMQSFVALENSGDILPSHPTAAQTRSLLHDAIRDTRQTYSVTFGQGGTQGANLSIVDVLAVTPLPAGVGPAVGASHTGAASVQVGSNVHGGLVIVGAQHGLHGEVGANGVVGKKLANLFNLGLTATAMPLVVDYTHTRAAAIRTRMDTIGAAAGTGASGTEAWRTLLLDVTGCITGDDRAPPPANPAQMWERLAERFHADPNLSIDDLHAHLTTAGGFSAVTAGARVALPSPPLQVGPGATIGFSKTYRTVQRQADRGGNRTTEASVHSAGHGGSASIGLTCAFPGITSGFHDNAGHPGTTQSLALPSAGLGAGVQFLRNITGVTFRLVTDQGRVDPDYSVRDTETGSARSFAAYIDSQRDDWVAALGGGDAAARQLDVFLTRLRHEEKRGNVTYGERRRLTPLAARRIDYFRALAAAVGGAGDGDGAAGGSKREIARLQAEVTRVLCDPASWDPRSLWSLDLDQATSSKGWTLVLQAYSRLSSTAAHQHDALIAPKAPRRDEDEAVF